MSDTTPHTQKEGTPIRCKECGKLLAKVVSEGGSFEVKCPRCGALTVVEEK